jgi:uncharacterized membrane protein
MRPWRGGTVPETIEGYLAQLRKALAGADPALVQDAAYDAEEYLRSAAAEGGNTPDAIDAAIEAYGSPSEIASAYRETERTVVAALRRPTPTPKSTNPIARFFGVIADPGAWGALFYMLLSLLTGTLYFTVVVTGLSISTSLMILIIGLPIALLFIGAVRAISLAEGRLVEGLLGVRMPRRPRTVGAQGGLIERVKSWFTDYRTWTTMLYMLLMLPVGVTYFTVIVTGLASLALVAAPFVQVIFDTPVFRSFDYAYYLEPWGMPLVFAAGLLGFFVTLWLAKGVGFLHGAFAKALLVGRLEGDSTGAPVGPIGPVPAEGAGDQG